MLIGSIIVAFCILVLGWTREIVGCFITDIELVSESLELRGQRYTFLTRDTVES